MVDDRDVREDLVILDQIALADYPVPLDPRTEGGFLRAERLGMFRVRREVDAALAGEGIPRRAVPPEAHPVPFSQPAEFNLQNPVFPLPLEDVAQPFRLDDPRDGIGRGRRDHGEGGVGEG